MIERIFISSVQKELQTERYAIRDFVRSDPLLRRFFDVFLFEDLPASDRRSDEVYLDEVGRCTIYAGIFGEEYGSEDDAGLSPTEREFDQATARGNTRLIFVKGAKDASRHPKMRTLVQKAGKQLIRRRFSEIPDLTASLYASLVEHLDRADKLRTKPFDAAACMDATLADISAEKLRDFLGIARRQRQYPLDEKTPRAKALAHLNLLDKQKPNHAAVLLFGKQPQRFLLTSEVKCLHFDGVEVRKPIPSYQVYRGTAFELVDQAVDFVMSRIDRYVGTREHSAQAPVKFELPRKAVAEAIVNAVAHRDYTSNASVQVMLFADRLEIWNPGQLPPDLTLEKLRLPHWSIPHNPLLAEPLFLARYIERAGTGTLDMIALSREAGLPEPDFRQDGGQFVQTLWRDWLTTQEMTRLGLNERQRSALAHVKIARRLTNREYQSITGASERTASRELHALMHSGVLEKIGETGRGTVYRLCQRKPAINPPNPPEKLSAQTRHKPAKPAKRGAKRTGARRTK